MSLSENNLHKSLELILNEYLSGSNSIVTKDQLQRIAVKSYVEEKRGERYDKHHDFNAAEQKEDLYHDGNVTPEGTTSSDSSLCTDLETESDLDLISAETFDTNKSKVMKLMTEDNIFYKEAKTTNQETKTVETMESVFHDVKSVILSFLNQRDVAKTCRVCKDWRSNSQYIQCIQSYNTIGLDILKENITKVPRLVCLDLWCLWLGDAGSRELAMLLKEYKLLNLQRLKIFIMASDIKASGTKYLLEELRRGICPNLRTLDLNQNSFGDTEVQSLGEVLKTVETEIHNNNSKNKKDHPKENCLHRSYIESSVIEKKHFLTFLYDKENAFRKKEISRRNSYGFDTLNLRQNRISEEGLLKFANNLMELGMPILTQIDLRRNKVDKDAIARLSRKFPAINFKV